MPSIKFIINKSSSMLSIHGSYYSLPENSLVVMGDEPFNILTEGGLQSKYNILDFSSVSLQQLYLDVVGLIEIKQDIVFNHEPFKIIQAEKGVIEVFSSLAQLSLDDFLYFTYIYCLNLDRCYFSAFLRRSVSGNESLSSFIEENFMKPWPIVRFAQEIGLPLRKFNQLFQDCYGKPAKRWLIERRLKYAKKLLSTTTMRMLDIALECGFSNHAHFSDSFRRYFLCSPKQFRLQSRILIDNSCALNHKE